MKILIDDRALAAFNRREQVFERFKFTVIDHNKLTEDQKEIYSLVWHDLVEFVNQSLVRHDALLGFTDKLPFDEPMLASGVLCRGGPPPDNPASMKPGLGLQ